jgi:hypothetical protein
MTRSVDASSHRAVLVAGSVGFLLVGVALGSLLAFWQAARVILEQVSIPWGVVAAVIILTVVIRIAISMLGSRWAGAAVLAGWLIATIALSTRTPWAGDLIISAGTRQLVYLMAGVVAGAAAASVPSRRA